MNYPGYPQQQAPGGYPQQQPQGYPQQQPQGYPQQQPQGYPQQQPQGYPQQQPPNYPPAPGAVPSYPGTPPGQAGYPGQQAPQGYPPAYGGYPQPAPAMPQFHVPDNGATAAEYQRGKEEAQRSGRGVDGPQYLKFPGPDGSPKWDQARVGFESVLRVHIAPPWKADKPIFKKVSSHFWRSAVNPMGTSLPCPGEQCLICRARDAILTGAVPADANMQKRAKDFGKVRKQWLYNIFLLDNPQAHMDAKQQMRPLILAAGASLHTVLGDLVDACGGALQLVHPQQGRPVRLRKVKRGPSNMEVDYFAMPLDRAPLPPHFYPALGALHDLDTLERVPSQEEMLKAIHELGFPHPGNFSLASSFGGPQAPAPYSAEPYSPGVSNAPPPNFAPSYPQQQQAPQGYPQQPPMYPDMNPPAPLGPGYPSGQFAPPMPSGLNPPPVYSGLTQAPPSATPYQPQPSQAAPMGDPQQSFGGGGMPPGGPTPSMAPPPMGQGSASAGMPPPPYNPMGAAPQGQPPAQGQQGWGQNLDDLRQQLRGMSPPGQPGTPGGY